MKRYSLVLSLLLAAMFTANAQVNLSNGLVAYYPFTGNAGDSSGNGLHGNVTGATLTTDRFGNSNKAYYFSGSHNSYISVPYNSAFNLKDTFSFSFWIKMDPASNGSISTVLSKGANNVNNYSYYVVTGSYDRFFLRQSSSITADVTASGNHIPFNKWTFVTCIRDGKKGEMRYYVNDTLKETVSTGFIFSSNANYPLVIGRHFSTSSGGTFNPYPFKGIIDEVRIYDRILNRDEISRLFNGMHDLRITSIYRPFSSGCQDTLYGKLGVVVENSGDTAASNFNVHASVSGPFNHQYSEQYTGTLAAGQTDTVYFTDSIDISFGADYNITAYTEYILDNNLLNDTAKLTFYNSPFPLFNISGEDTICAGLASYTTRKEASFNYDWNVNGGTIIVGKNTDSISVIWSTGGVHHVSLKVTNANGCNMTNTKNITAIGPIASFSVPSNEVCTGSPVDFTDLSSVTDDSIISRFWTFGDGANCLCLNPTRVYTNPGAYKVNLTITTKRGCTHSFSDTITVSENPVLSISGADTVCMGNAVYTTFPDASSMYNWIVTGGTIVSGQGTNAVEVDWSPGQGNITLEVTNSSGCTANGSKSVTVKEPVSAAFTMSASTTCILEAIKFTDATVTADSIVSWSWDFGDGNNCLCEDPQHVYNVPGTYQVGLTVTTSGGCQSTLYDSIMISEKPVASFNAPDVCAGVATQFTNTSQGNNMSAYLWVFDNTGDSAKNEHPTYTFKEPGAYSVQLITYNTGGCSDTVLETVTVYPVPSANIQKSIDQRTVTFTVNDTTYESYTWDFGDQTYTGLTNPTHTYNQDGTYIVKLTITNSQGCETHLTDTVEVNSIGIEDPSSGSLGLNIYPNPFTNEIIVSCLLDKQVSLFFHLYNSFGQEIYNGELQNMIGNSKSVIDLSSKNIRPGIYFIAVEIEGQLYKHELLKLK